MASLKTYLLRVWAEGDAVAGEDPIQLLRQEDGLSLTLVASHQSGVANSTGLEHQGEQHNLTTLLTQNNLRRSDLMAAAGNELYRRLALGKVGEELKKIGLGIRVMLDLQSPSLVDLPWELLRRDGHSLFQFEQHPWLLGSPDPPAPDPLFPGQMPLHLPLRVLLLVGNDPNDKKVLGDDELRCLEDCLHSRRSEVLLRVLDRPEPEKILELLCSFEPHVLHFIGHGDVISGATPKPVIRVFSRKTGKNEVWDAERIKGGLKSRVPRLVILNACDTSGACSTQTWRLTNAFFKCGVGAILAMQAEILGSAALEFGQRLYRGLADGLAIDVALARARSEVANALQGADPARANWPVPRLWVRGNADEVVRMTAVESGLCSAEAKEDFVHRWPQRSAACRVLCPFAEHGRRLVVLEGPAQSGKTALLKILGETWARSGGDALYVDLQGPRTSDLRFIVKRTREELEKPEHRLLDATPLQGIDLDLPSERLGAEFRTALEAVAATVDAAAPGTPPPDKPSERAPLLLLLDGLETWQPDVVVDTVIPEICVPYSLPDPHSRVWLAIALRKEKSDSARTFAWKNLGEENQPIQVEDFRPEEWRRAASQFIRWHLAQVPDDDKRKSLEAGVWGMAWLKPPDLLDNDAMASYSPMFLNVIRNFSAVLSKS